MRRSVLLLILSRVLRSIKSLDRTNSLLTMFGRSTSYLFCCTGLNYLLLRRGSIMSVWRLYILALQDYLLDSQTALPIVPYYLLLNSLPTKPRSTSEHCISSGNSRLIWTQFGTQSCVDNSQ